MTAPFVALAADDALGEGPTWCTATGRLLRVDLPQGAVHAWDPATGDRRTRTYGGQVTAVVPRAGGGRLVARDRELQVEDAAGAITVLATVDEPPENRFNDCRCDPRGRLWAGTMSMTRRPGTAALYRLIPGGSLERVLTSTVANGLGWSPAGDRLYFVDSMTQRVDVLDVDAGGDASSRRPFAVIAPEDGIPDGLCVDSAGGVWVCLFGTGGLRRYDPAGAVAEQIRLPVPHATCPAFGGPDLATLYVTTAAGRLTDRERAAAPWSGSVLALRPGVSGLPATPFAG